MSGAGRPPNAEHLRLVDKAHAHRYKDSKGVEESKDLPVAPDYLGERGKQIFNEFVKRLSDIGIASDTDFDAIILYVKNQEELEYLENFLRQNGHTYTSESAHGVSVKKYPESEIYIQCKSLKLKILAAFGLTPSDRKKVKAKAPEKKKKNPFAALDEAATGG